MNLALLKKFRIVGADGAIIRGLEKLPNKWWVLSYGEEAELHGLLVEQENIQIEFIPRPSVAYSLKARLRPLREMYIAIRQRRCIKEERWGYLITGSSELALTAEIAFAHADRKFALTSDLTPFHLRPSSRILILAVDYFLFRVRGWVPVITSPGFYIEHFSKLGIPIETCRLVHNIPDNLPWITSEPFLERSGLHLQLVWAGLIRCNESARLLSAALNKLDNLSIIVAGDTRWINSFSAQLFDSSRVHMVGQYTANELPDIYARGNMAWCCDWSLDANSKALLPNRLYQAIASSRPLLASKGSFLGSVVEHYDIGVCVENDVNGLVDTLSSITDDVFERWVKNLRTLRKYIDSLGNQWVNIAQHGHGRMSNLHTQGQIFS